MGFTFIFGTTHIFCFECVCVKKLTQKPVMHLSISEDKWKKILVESCSKLEFVRDGRNFNRYLFIFKV